MICSVKTLGNAFFCNRLYSKIAAYKLFLYPHANEQTAERLWRVKFDFPLWSVWWKHRETHFSVKVVFKNYSYTFMLIFLIIFISKNNIQIISVLSLELNLSYICDWEFSLFFHWGGNTIFSHTIHPVNCCATKWPAYIPCCLCCTKWLRWLAFGVPFCRDCSTSSACLLSTRTLEYKSGSARASSRFLILVSRSFNFSCSATGLAPNRFRLGACQFPKNKEKSNSSTVSGGNWNRIESKQLSKGHIS